MSSNRPKLILDEQAFQGLLAAAFTIQDHNDRKKLGSAPAPVANKPSRIADALELCQQCGRPLPAEAASCAACGAEKLRPGERLQRTWASMWLKSQDQGLNFDAEGAAGADVVDSSSARGGNGRRPADSDRAASSAIGGLRPVKAKPTLATSGLAAGQPAEAESEVSVPDSSQPDSAVLDSAQMDLEWLPVRSDLHEQFEHSGLSLSSDALAPGEAYMHDEPSLEDAALEDPSLSEHETEPQAEPHAAPPADPLTMLSDRFRDLRVKLRFHKADLYLALAIFVAALALLWPAATSLRPSLPAWQRMLIAMGIAEAPPPAVHYRGDPNIKVWVDTHAALYYCPGDELYGKSPDGHYTTQREAQADDFEPAQRSACIQ